MILLLLLRRCLSRILKTCRLWQCDMKNRLHSTLKQLVAFKTTIKYSDYGCFYPANTVERGYLANFNKYEPKPEAWWFEYVEWIVFVACIWWRGLRCSKLFPFSYSMDGWENAIRRSCPFPSWEFGLFDRIIQMKCLLKGDDESKMPFGIGVWCDEDIGRVEKETLFTNETPMFSYNSLYYYSELVLWLKCFLRNAMNSTQWVVAEMWFMVNSFLYS